MNLRWIIVALSLLLPGDQSLADDLVGNKASVIDGDTIEIGATRIRLWGIDAPESNQLCRANNGSQYPCGAKATHELAAFISERPVNCEPVSLDENGQTSATCSVDGVDLGGWLVRNGFALDWPQYSKGKYDSAQREADHAGRGIWEGNYVAPWLFRACLHEGGSAGACSDDANAHP